MACPFFSPSDRADNIALPHPARLPLGGAWRGTCTAPGGELVQLGATELESCNLGYAHACPRLPEQRAADAVRFAVSRHSADRLQLQFVLEAKHLPVEDGKLEYDRILSCWTAAHPDPGIQKLAECFLQMYLERNTAESRLA
jgi:hypothetical protein